MQIAVISDIQGNGIALEFTLQHIERYGIDLIVCLGDLASGPEPANVLSLLREKNVTCVRGNMDETILNPPAYSGSDEDERKYAAMDHWCHTLLPAADRDYLRELPLTYAFELGLLTGLCFHGSPHSPEDVIEAITPAEQLNNLLSDVRQAILMTGHMHQPMLRMVGEQFILNPGSVGLPYGGRRLIPTRAEYAVISATGLDFTIAFHQVQYDPVIFKQRVLDSGMPYAEWYLSKWNV